MVHFGFEYRACGSRTQSLAVHDSHALDAPSIAHRYKFAQTFMGLRSDESMQVHFVLHCKLTPPQLSHDRSGYLRAFEGQRFPEFDVFGRRMGGSLLHGRCFFAPGGARSRRWSR